MKTGYKETKWQVFPEDWAIRRLGKVAGFQYGLGEKGRETGDYVYIRISDITPEGFLNKKNLVFVEGEKVKANCVLNKGDVLVARTGASFGKTYLYRENFMATYGGFLIRFLLDNGFIDNEFFFHFSRSDLYWNQANMLVSGGAQPQFNANTVADLIVPCPPLPEQVAIAEALSSVDTLLESLDKLIEKKKDIKQGALRELLTGKTRLPKYSGEWKGKKNQKYVEVGTIPEDWSFKRFEDVMTGFASGQTPSRAKPEYFKGNIPWITSGELNYNIVLDTREKITPEAVRDTNLKIIPKGTFLFAITGLEAEGTRGSCGITGVEATTNQSCMALYPKEGVLTARYLFHYYVGYGKRLALKYCQGTKQQSYTGAVAKLLPIILPPTIEEQCAIAQVLSDMDLEIEALEQEREKYKQLKIGMMQQLLTGRIRLKWKN